LIVTNNCPTRFAQLLALLLALLLAMPLSFTAGSLSAGSTVLDQAVKKYYAGHPDEAIAMIRPLASAGDTEAQYLLGNILFTLSNAGQLETPEDPSRWYRMAAEQDSAPAIYALGVIHNNRWLQSHRDEDLRLAESYFQKALDLGVQKAHTALTRLAAYKKDNRTGASLTYSNESFSSKREPSPKPQAAPAAKPASVTTTHTDKLTDTLAGFERSGDPAADAEMLKQMLSQLEEDDSPDISALTQLLGSFESTKQLLPDLLKLFDHTNTASEINTAPGSN
jgi:hypothetical protein